MHANSLFVPSIGFATQYLRGNCINSQHQRIYRRRCQSIPFSRLQTRHFVGSDSFGLTEDGDFAMFGVNMQDPDEDQDKPTVGQSLSGNISSLLTGTIFDNANANTKPFTTGTPIDWQNVGTAPIVSSARGSRADDAHFGLDMQRGLHEKALRDLLIQKGLDEDVLNEIEEYLMEIMPTLSETDVENYAMGLGSIGFHPKCVTLCELKLEDLDFMKVLHRRYFFNEVTGGEHPFEV
jgi:hypothetical protein